jgi:hypothetical protein
VKTWLQPSLDQLARDTLDDFDVGPTDEQVGIGEAQHSEEPVPS